MTEAELKVALEDPMWRISHLYKIIVKSEDGDEGKVITFKPNWAQMVLLAGLHYRDLILKARQLGFTTLASILFLDYALFRENIRAGIIAHKLEDAEAIFNDKVKFAYENLPETLKQAFPLKRETTKMLVFAHNNSSIRVSTSMRSGTIDYLHVSEFGKICALFPARAKEIVTGSFPAVPKDGLIIVESTAEGKEGYYYDYAETAKAAQQSGKKLNEKDFKFFFFPWWRAAEYRMNPEGIIIDEKDHTYFNQIEAEIGQEITLDQRAWYVQTRDVEQAGDYAMMWREYPSTPEEAFQQSTEGTYYATQLAIARKEGRITHVPYAQGIPVNTFWDIGLNDEMAIWFHQRVGNQDRFIRYYENSGESFDHYVNYMQTTGYVWGTHYLPHDGDTERLGAVRNWTPREMLEELGLRNIEIVPRIPILQTGIQMTRDKFGSAWFDETNCKVGLAHLAQYRKEWDRRLGVYKDTHRHDKASNAADALRQWAQGFSVSTTTQKIRRKGSWRTI
ncbi:MAG TPA: terminase [Oligella sp.]|nr:terminase [Oligella sp.]